MERPATTHTEPSAVTAPSAPAAPAELVRPPHAHLEDAVLAEARAAEARADDGRHGAIVPEPGGPASAEAASSGPAPAGATAAQDEDEGHHVFELPRIRALLVHALPRFFEGVIAPVLVFYAALTLLGLNGALVAAVAWVYGGIAYRYLRGHPVSGMLMLAAVGVTVRAGLSAATGSAVVYFLQPTLGTLIVSMSFLASVPLGKPLAMKLAKDMAPIPEAFLKHGRVHRFFLKISLLWSMVLFTNVLVSVWMLFNQSIGTYLWLRTSIVAALGAVGVGLSVWGFKRLLRHIDWKPAGSA
ncbi:MULTISPECIES: VC0807 family protein [Actinomadura]|uniref:VC0807 family protein n=1 Tax=Actinomadura TaxID=1988 RepID=UPI00041463D9|nr:MULTISPECIES: VC0807 family protein [Actinomadura]